MQAIGGQPVQIRFEPFAETARLLYTTAFMAERYAGIRAFVEGKVGLSSCTPVNRPQPFEVPNARSTRTPSTVGLAGWGVLKGSDCGGPTSAACDGGNHVWSGGLQGCGCV